MGYRVTEEKDLQAVMELIHDAQRTMREAGLDQWQNGHPSEEEIRNDIRNREGRVWEEDGKILGTAMLSFRGEPNYETIVDGSWNMGDIPYGTIHRVAVLSTDRRQGTAGKILKEMEKECREQGFTCVRMDTHQDNVPMRTWLGRHGFVYCGVITMKETMETRLAFEKKLSGEE